MTSNVGTSSIEHSNMLATWQLIDAILEGPIAVRAARQTYLPQYEGEDLAEYNRRLASAPWRAEFEDALEGMASKPFSKEVALQGDVSERIKEIAEDVDGCGHNLHTFAEDCFREGIAKGQVGILVDYPSLEGVKTVADEKARGVRPYWIAVYAQNIIALYSEFVDGREIITHLRVRETITEREPDGYGEVQKERIRVLEPNKWELWEREITGSKRTEDFKLVNQGVMTIGYVPFIRFITGKRKGTLTVRPPLLGLADIQMELYRSLSRQDEILTYAGSPMLSGEGIAQPEQIMGAAPAQPVSVGPKRVLYSGETSKGDAAKWVYVQPDAANIKEVREHNQGIIEDMRRLALQPSIKKVGNPTATGQAIDEAKAHTILQSWATRLKDVLEQALKFTSEWIKEAPTAQVFVHTDFSVSVRDAEAIKALIEMRSSRDLSRLTLWDEMRRRNILGPQFDPEVEQDQIDQEPPPLGSVLPPDDPSDDPPDDTGSQT